MVTKCAWCGKILCVTSDHADLITHGICWKCLDDIKAEMAEVNDENQEAKRV